MRHIDHEVCAHFVSYIRYLREVYRPGVCACAGNDHLGLAFESDSPHFIVIYLFRFAADAVRYKMEILTRHIYGAAVREMAAVRKIHTHDGVARIQHREEHRLVCLRAGIRLHIGRFRAINLLDAIERQLSHKDGNKIRSTYNQAQYLDERRRMMQAWSDYLDGLRAGGNVVPIKRSA